MKKVETKNKAVSWVLEKVAWLWESVLRRDAIWNSGANGDKWEFYFY